MRDDEGRVRGLPREVRQRLARGLRDRHALSVDGESHPFARLQGHRREPREGPHIGRPDVQERQERRARARLALADPALLFPVRLRSESSFAKSMGFRLPDVSPERFHELDRSGWPGDFERTVWPMVGAV